MHFKKQSNFISKTFLPSPLIFILKHLNFDDKHSIIYFLGIKF